MNIIDAIKKMQPKSGNIVGCKMIRSSPSWGKGDYIRIEYGQLKMFDVGYHETFSWIPSVESLLAEDWKEF